MSSARNIIMRDVKKLLPAARSFLSTAATPPTTRPSLTLTHQTRIQARISNQTYRSAQIYRSTHNMSNNAELQLGQVFNVKDKVRLTCGGCRAIADCMDRSHLLPAAARELA
jgi:hypothetical protein